MNSTPTDSCADPGQKLLSVEQGRNRILAAVPVIEAAEQLHLRAALNRILCEPVISKVDVPAFANSAMDGYAVRSEDCPDLQSVVLKIAGTSFAGAPFAGDVSAGQCVRIMTGALMPDGADAVLMQEHVRRDAEQIRFEQSIVKRGQNVRYAGEDTRCGDTVLHAGQRLGDAELGLLASVGVAEVRVTRRLRVAFFSTGDELASVGTPLGRGQIYDSNRYTLGAMISRLNLEPVDMGVVGDNREQLEEAFAEAAGADAIITSGGVSVGAADFVTETLERMGSVGFWKVAMKPGKPIAFGRIRNALFFGLPGNPVSVMATFYQLVRPALERLRGIEHPPPPILLPAVCTDRLRKRPGRVEFQRGVLERGNDGRYTVRGVDHQGAGVLSSMAVANCFIVLAAEREDVAAGSEVAVQPFSGLI